MSFEDALALRDSRHPDLEDERYFFRDQGTVSTVLKLKEKGARQIGPEIIGEQVSLFFESQTREELEVEQDPEVLDKVKERENIIRQRDEMAREMSKRSRRMSRTERVAQNSKLPKVPEMPKLRPNGAEAELMFVSRSLRFPINRGPHQDNVIKAMTDKYGTPSIHIKNLSSRGGNHLLEWSFDASNARIQNSKGRSVRSRLPRRLAKYRVGPVICYRKDALSASVR